jgi:hypothetical protein
MTTGLGVHPEQIDATPGAPAVVVVTVTNDQPTPSQFQVRVVGSDADWSGAPHVTPLLDPGAHTAVELTVELPLGFPAGDHLLGVEVVPLTPSGTPSTDQRLRRVADLVVAVGSLSGLHAVLEPRTVYGRKRAQVGHRSLRAYLAVVRNRGARRGQAQISLRNRSYEPMQVSLTASSPGDEVTVRFDRTNVVVPAGHIVPIKAKVRGSRPLFGQPRRTPFTVEARGRGNPVYLEGSYYRSARIRPGAIKGVGILTVLALWAGTLAIVYDRVTADDEPEQATAQQASETADGSGSGDGGSGDGGRGGFQDLSLRSAPVEASGQVTAREPEGVRVRVRSVSLVDEISQDAIFHSGPRGTTTRGVKLFGRRGGMIHNRIVPAELSTATDPEGRWAIADLGGPGFFEVRFSKPGYATRAYIVEMPDDGSPIVLDTDMEAGDGGISGFVLGPDGPLGGADITVTDGTVTLSTTTPTTGSVGQWSVDGLTTPGSYLVTASRRGYGTATSLVRLSGGQTISGVQIQMQPGTGAITGRVRSSAGPLGDITISATDGDVVRTATTLTEGPVGSFTLPDLPSPGVYTLTIEGDGWLSQTRDIALTGGQATVDVEMTARTGIAYGRITDTAGTPLGGVGITAISEDHEYKNTTAPDGRFELVGLEPGSYVIEFSSFEHHTGSSLVAIGSGSLREVNLSLVPRDNLEPPPNNSLTFSFSAEGDITVTERTTGVTASTGGGASASFTNLPAGVRTFDITGVGFQPAVVQFRMGLNGPFSTSVTLRPLVIVDIEVRARIGGAPLPGAEVTIRRNDPLACPDTNLSVGCQPFVGVSDADGNVLGPDGAPPELTDGPWFALATLDGYAASSAAFTTSYDTSPTTEVEILLDKFGEVSLSIREPQLAIPIRFNLLQGVTITVVGGPADGRTYPGVVDGQDQVNPYLIEALPPGDYRFRLEKDGYRTIEFPSTPLSVPLNSVQSFAPIMVPRTAGTSGQVVWSRNGVMTPVPGAFVRITGIANFIQDADPPTEVPGTWATTSGADGRFVFEGDEGPIFGDADIQVSYPQASSEFVANAFVDGSFPGLPSNTDVGQLELIPRNSDLYVPLRLQFGEAPSIDSRPWQLRLRAVDGPAGYPTGTFSPNGWGGTLAQFYLLDIPAGDYRFEASYVPADAGDLNRFSTIEFDVYVPPGRRGGQIVQAAEQLVPAKGRISGEVFTLQRGDPPPGLVVDALWGADVRLYQVDTGGLETLVRSEEPLTGSTFNFLELDAGDYRIEFEREGYTLSDVPQVGAFEFTLGVGAHRVVNPRFRPLASVIFQVVGQLVAGGTQELDPNDLEIEVSQAGATPIVRFVNAPDGDVWEIIHLDQGPVTITISAPGVPPGYETFVIDLSDDPDAFGAPLGWGEIRQLPQIQLQQIPATLTFAVESTAGGGGVPDGLVIELRRDGTLVTDLPTFDADTGLYTFSGLAPGGYSLHLNAPNHQPLNVADDALNQIAAGQTVSLGTLQLVARRNTVSGTIELQVGSSTPVAGSGVLVQLGVVSEGTADYGHADAQSYTTGADPDLAAGAFLFVEVPDGTYRIRASKDGYGTVESSTDLVLVNAAEVENANALLQAPTHNVTVSVASAVDGDLPGASVRLVPNPNVADNTTNQSYPSANGSLTTDGDGEVTFDEVVPGHYLIQVDGSTANDSIGPPVDPGDPDELVSSGRRSVTVTYQLQVSSTPAQPGTVTIAEARVNGTITISGSGSPVLSGSRVEIWTQPATGSSERVAELTIGSGQTTTDYRIYTQPDVAATTFQVRSFGPPSGSWLGSTQTITNVVDGGIVNGVNLAITEAASVNVVVREAGTATPIQGATITYIAPVTNQTMSVTDGGTGDTDGQANGTIQLTGLRPGTYNFTVVAGPGYGTLSSGNVALASGTGNADIVIAPIATGQITFEVVAGDGNSFQVRLTPGANGEEFSVHSLSASPASARILQNVRTGTYDAIICRPSMGTCTTTATVTGIVVTRNSNTNTGTITPTTTTTTTTTES